MSNNKLDTTQASVGYLLLNKDGSYSTNIIKDGKTEKYIIPGEYVEKMILEYANSTKVEAAESQPTELAVVS